MKLVQESCSFLTGLRRSVGTQTFDDSLLAASKRAYTFLQLKDFFQQLSVQKSPSMRYNLDLIAFGKLLDGIPRGQQQVERFESLLESKLFDSVSLYTLELFPGSDWYHQSHHTSKAVQKVYGNDDMIFDEFVWLRNCIYKY
jgi:coproporphyrinogen III oxidase-like Fe-S oxidoreductase